MTNDGPSDKAGAFSFSRHVDSTRLVRARAPLTKAPTRRLRNLASGRRRLVAVGQLSRRLLSQSARGRIRSIPNRDPSHFADANSARSAHRWRLSAPTLTQSKRTAFDAPVRSRLASRKPQGQLDGKLFGQLCSKVVCVCGRSGACCALRRFGSWFLSNRCHLSPGAAQKVARPQVGSFAPTYPTNSCLGTKQRPRSRCRSKLGQQHHLSHHWPKFKLTKPSAH